MTDLILPKLFLNLLSAAILNKPADDNLFEGLDASTWKNIETIARSQSVSALIADKALSFSNKCLPPKNQIMAFVSHVEQTKALNQRMINILHKLADEYDYENIHFVLLKGLSVSMNYPNPFLRNPGDIDILIYRKGDYEKSKVWLEYRGINTEIGDRIHYKYIFNNVIVENHSRTSYFDNRKYDKIFIKWEEEIYKKEDFEVIEIGGNKVRQLPVEMNAFFIFLHLFKHFAHTGVGFRQYCDWLLFLQKNHYKIDSDSFSKLAETYSLLYPMQVFARAAVKYLKAPEYIFPFKMINDNNHVDAVIDDIFKCGNFGFHKPGKKRPTKNKILLRTFIFIESIKRSIKFGSLSNNHIRMMPLWMILNLFLKKV